MSQGYDENLERFLGGNGGPRRGRNGGQVTKEVDRLPPHSIEAEQGVLGCCLLEPKEVLGVALERIGTRDEVFYDLRHQALFEVLRSMVNGGLLIDPISVQQVLKDRNQLEALGGMPYIVSLMNAVPGASNIEYYLETVLGKYRLRSMVAACTKAVGRIYDEQDRDVTEVLNSIESDVLAAGESGLCGGQRIFSMREVMQETTDLIENCFHRGAGVIDGVRTWFGYLDKMVGGLHNGEMIVIAARPSCGKTALMLNLAVNAAKHGDGVGIFSIEMLKTALGMRILCGEAGVNMQQIRTGFGTERDLVRLASTAGPLSKLPMWFDDTPGLDIGTFRAVARRMKRLGAKVIMLDYLQLMRDPDCVDAANRQVEVANISAACKACAKELNVPVVVLAQLNRETEKNRNRKPVLSDLRESGAIEQDADLVGLLYRPEVKRSEEEEEAEDGREMVVVPVNLLVAKQRNGPTGDVEFLFHKEHMKFADKYAGTGKEEGVEKARGALMTNDEMTNDKGEERKGGVDFSKHLKSKKKSVVGDVPFPGSWGAGAE